MMKALQVVEAIFLFGLTSTSFKASILLPLGQEMFTLAVPEIDSPLTLCIFFLILDAMTGFLCANSSQETTVHTGTKMAVISVFLQMPQLNVL